MSTIKQINYILFIVIFVFLLILLKLHYAEAKTEANKMDSLVKFVTQKDGIKEYRLKNGLKVLLKSNQSIPLVTFSIWYKTGSRNETPGTYGLAHFLEHMMFKGTRKYKKGEISEIINGLGGVYNAFTSVDCTAYYETISPKHLEKVIEIEADRFKGSIFDEKELKLEKNVVLSELEGNLNNPVTLLDQTLRETAYESSSYKHPTIGYKEDIINIDSNIMRDFYKRFYNPQNATIVLAGDFNENSALNLIEKYFGIIKNDDDISDPEITIRDEPQKKEKNFTIKRTGSFKLLELAYHIPDSKDPDIYPLNIIEEILIKGENSPLNKALIETGLATEIQGGAEVNSDPGLFYILASLTPKATHKKVEKIITKEIDGLINNPPNEKLINAAKNRIKANYLFNLDGSFQQVLNTGFFEMINNWKESIDWTKNIEKVTQEQVSDALKEYFQKKNRTIGYFIPDISQGQKYEPVPLSISRTQHFSLKSSEKQNLTSQLSAPDSFQFKYKKQLLKDGSSLLIYKNIDLPVTYITGLITGGSSLLAKEDEWNCELIARTLEKGSKNYTKDQVKDILDSTGSQISFSCDEESFNFKVATLNENIIQTVNLLTDLLINPSFPKEEVKKETEKLVAEIIESKDNTNEIANRRFTQIIYTKDHPYYSNNFEEDIKLVKQIDNNDLIKAHEKIIKNKTAIISIVSNLKSKEYDNAVKVLEDGLSADKTKTIGTVNIPDTLLRDLTKEESIFVAEKPQSDVYLGHAGNLKRTDPDFYKVYIANYILGGSSLSSRLSKKVRDGAGLVYTIYSYYNASFGKGDFGIYFGSNNDNVDKAVALIKDEIENFADEGITEEELKIAKASLIDSFISRNLSTNKKIGSTLVGIEFYNLEENYITEYPKIINSLKLKDINSTIKKYIFPAKLNIVVAGEYTKTKNPNLKAESRK